MTPIIEWLDADVRDKLREIWSCLQPAIWSLHDVNSTSHTDKAENAQFVLGSRLAVDSQDGFAGSVKLACGTAMTPSLGAGDAVGGEKHVHLKTHAGSGTNRRIDRTSLFLPVPEGHHYTASAPDAWAETGSAASHFAIARTSLKLGDWTKAQQNFWPDTDGFVFCSCRAGGWGDRGYITCWVDGVEMAKASVHWYNDNHHQNTAICVPVPKGSNLLVNVTETARIGDVTQSVWWLPVIPTYWRFKKAEELVLGTTASATDDGFVNAVLTAPLDGTLGTLRLECADEVSDPPNPLAFHACPIASVAVHGFHPSDQWMQFASAMLPVRRGYKIWSQVHSTHGAVQAKAYWTPVVRAT